MRKKLLFALLGITAVFVTSCSKTSTNTIQYLPCQTEKNADWGFVDSKGNVVCADMFKEQPSFVREGVFSVKESNGLYTLYAFDVKKPTILLEDLKYVGSPRGGLLPICRKDSRIEIIDTKGQTKFTLLPIDNKPVRLCGSLFRHGYLIVATEDGKNGLVNNSGEVIIKPEYNFLLPLNKDFIFATKDGDLFFLNEKGEKYGDWKDEDLKNTSTFDWLGESPIEYLVVIKDDRRFLFNQKGEQILKCPDRVKDIVEIRNGYFVYKGDDGYGVMDFKGERIINDKYMTIRILDDGFLARRDEEHDYELINKKGEVVSKINDMKPIYRMDGFSNVGVDGNDEYVLDKTFVPVHKNALYQVAVEDKFSENIQSDYFDIDYVVELVSTAKETTLYDANVILGKKLQESSFLKMQKIDNYNQNFCMIPNYAFSPLYRVDLIVYFDRTSFKEVYKDVTVQRYNYYYGYYNDTERQFSHYDKNPEAVINRLAFQVFVPDGKEDAFFKKLCDALDHKYTKVKDAESDSMSEDNVATFGGYIYTDNQATYEVCLKDEISLEIYPR